MTKEAFEEAKRLTALHSFDFYKLKLLYEEAKSIDVDNSNLIIDLNCKITNNLMSTAINDKNIPMVKKQALFQLLVVAGISFFERFCKDWFRWGLMYHPNRIKIYTNKKTSEFDINILEILESENPKKTIINKISKKVDFLKTEKSSNEFKNIFKIELFQDRQERYDLEKYIEDRHVIVHNSGFIDEKYIKKRNLSETDVGNILAKKDKDIEKFLQLLEKILNRLTYDLPKMVYKNIEKTDTN